MTSPETTSCAAPTVLIADVHYERDSQYFDGSEKCHDCGIANVTGNCHHADCDVELCPRCGGQLLSCGCLDPYLQWKTTRNNAIQLEDKTYRIVFSENGRDIAYIPSNEPDGGNRWASLISAAPDLLAFCRLFEKQLIEKLRDNPSPEAKDQSILNGLMKAIFKAENSVESSRNSASPKVFHFSGKNSVAVAD